MAGLVEPRFTGQLVEYLIGPLHETGLRPSRGRQRRALALAIECFAEVRTLLPLQDVGERLLRAVCSLLDTTKGAFYKIRMILLNDITPAVEKIGERWPGRHAVQDWFVQRAPGAPHNDLALRMAAALYQQ